MTGMSNPDENKPNLWGKGIKISSLSNSMNYFINNVFIVKDSGNFRLLAIHNNKRLMDEKYDSAKGAKIAFLKLFWYRAWSEQVKPQWTHFYTPDEEWLGFKLNTPPNEVSC